MSSTANSRAAVRPPVAPIPSGSRDGNLNAEQLRKRAKDLKKDWRDGMDSAVARVRASHPHAERILADATPSTQDGEATISLCPPMLADTQLVVAREAGCRSWAELKEHLDALDEARRRIVAVARGEVAAAPDGDRPTVHVRCGHDLAGLFDAGFAGEYLPFVDPYCQGPTPYTADDEAFIATRTRFLAAAYGRDYDELAAAQYQEYDAFDDAVAEAERLVLWFEHDSYDQLILIRLLDRIAAAPRRPPVVELICVDRFPGVTRFVGLGQLCPEALHVLWYQRTPVTTSQYAHAKRTWRALRRGNPTALATIAAAGTPSLPFLSAALTRHLEELPWTTDGLSRNQRQTLDALAAAPGGVLDGAALFCTVRDDLEPLVYLGDVMYLHELRILLACATPPIAVLPEPVDSAASGTGTADVPSLLPGGAPWTRCRLQLTDIGRELLAGELGGRDIGLPTRWVGGVEVCLDKSYWAWDPGARDVVQQRR